MFAIVGLGNEGSRYDQTHHNMGFMTVDKFAEKFDFKFNKKKFEGKVAEGMIGNEKVILLKPSTFMNLSGQSVSKLVRMLKLDLKHLLVVYDDIDLPAGKIRLRQNGSAGTHNGMRSIISCLGTSEFSRLRIGVGRDEKMDLSDYVLSRVSAEKMQILEPAFCDAIKVIEAFIKNDGETSKINIK